MSKQKIEEVCHAKSQFGPICGGGEGEVYFSVYKIFRVEFEISKKILDKTYSEFNFAQKMFHKFFLYKRALIT